MYDNQQSRAGNGLQQHAVRPSRRHLGRRAGYLFAIVALAISSATASAEALATSSATAQHQPATSSAPATVWLCRPGLSNDPCTSGLQSTVVSASGSTSITNASDNTSSGFDCFYVYPTVSRELATNADLRVQKTEIAAAVAQASRFSQVCKVYAPIYRQVTSAGLAATPDLNVSASATTTAFDSIRAGFESYLNHYNDGRPIVFIGHSQGAAMLIMLLKQMVDNNSALRNRLVMAIILGGNVAVPTGTLAGGTFAHIPGCNALGESGCLIAYSSFPSTPPADSLFGRPGQGVSLQSGQRTSKGLQVLCVNPAALAGGRGILTSYFPSGGAVPTPWVTFPGLYSARCERSDGATWLEVTKATGSSDHRPIVTEADGPKWGYHAEDVNLALGNLITDVAAAEAHWRRAS